eukprot:7365904-Alexandrium_andersonii.AAC.1
MSPQPLETAARAARPRLTDRAPGPGGGSPGPAQGRQPPLGVRLVDLEPRATERQRTCREHGGLHHCG